MRLNLAFHADILIPTHWRARAIFLSYSVPEATKQNDLLLQKTVWEI